MAKVHLSSLSAAVMLALCGGPLPAAAQGVSVLSGNTGGSWYAIGAGLAQVLSRHGVRAEVEQGGGISNVLALDQRTDAVGFTNGFVLPIAAAGEAPFQEAASDVVAVAVLMDNHGQFVVSEESGVRSFPELAGESYISQPMSASSTIAFEKVLNAYGLSEADLDIERGDMSFGADALRDGRAIGFHATTAYPNGTISELSIGTDIRLLPVDDAAFEKIVADNPGFARAVIPAGTYEGLDEDVPTIRAPTILIANAEAPEDLIYDIVATMAENIGDVQDVHASLDGVTPESMADLGGLPVHPGAARYYQENGL